MNNVTLLFFATLKEITGVQKMNKSIPKDLLISGLKKMLADEFPGLRVIMSSVIVSLNHEFAFDNSPIPENAEIALFPPVSGG